MGVFGTGNLDNDGGLDNFYAIVAPLVEQLSEVVENPTLAEADELSDYYMATVEILSVLSQHIAIAHLTTELVTNCRDTMLSEWENTIDELDPDPEYKAARLLVMRQSFEKLLAGVSQWEGSNDSSDA